MGMNANEATLTGLQEKRKALKEEMLQVDREIRQEQDALGLVTAKLKDLERADRQAA
jgi:hypothetical protein